MTVEADDVEDCLQQNRDETSREELESEKLLIDCILRAFKRFNLRSRHMQCQPFRNGGISMTHSTQSLVHNLFNTMSSE